MNHAQYNENAVMTPERTPGSSLELRVLTGLQAGAALPLDQPITVGRGDDCDILLLDDQLPEHLLRIEVDQDGQLLLEPMEGALTDEHGAPLSRETVVVAGQVFGSCGVWMEVRPCQAPWTPWTDPADRPAGSTLPSTSDEDPDTDTDTDGPMDADDDALFAPSGHGPDAGMGGVAEQAGLAGEAAALHARPEKTSSAEDLPPEELDFDDWLADTPAVAADGSLAPSPWAALDSAPDALKGGRAKKPGAGTPWGVLAGGAALTVFGLAAMALQLLPRGKDDVNTGHAQRPPTPPMNPALATAPQMPPARTSTDASAESAIEAPSTATTTNKATTTVAAASQPAHGSTVLRGATAITLPFEVREVVMGARNRIVLIDGRVVVPGEIVGEWRLMEIRAGALVFDGPERVLLPW